MRPNRSQFRHFTIMPTRWGDHDSYGHVNNVVYHSYYESAVSGFLVKEGTLEIASSPVIGLIVENCCTYYSPVCFPDRITIGMRIAKLGNSSAHYEMALFRNDEEEASAAGYIVYVYVNRATNHSATIPDEIRSALLKLVESES